VKAWALSFFRRENFSFYYGGKRAYIERRKTMMKAIKNFMNKPWTLGTYFKCCGVGMGLSLAILGTFAAWAKWNEKKALKEMQESNQEEDNI
jgi:hypothetical protein